MMFYHGQLPRDLINHDRLQLLHSQKSNMIWKLQQKRLYPTIYRLSFNEIEMTDILEECDLTRVAENGKGSEKLERYSDDYNIDEIVIATSLPLSISQSLPTAHHLLEEAFEVKHNVYCDDDDREEEARWRFDYGEGKQFLPYPFLFMNSPFL